MLGALEELERFRAEGGEGAEATAEARDQQQAGPATGRTSIAHGTDESAHEQAGDHVHNEGAPGEVVRVKACDPAAEQVARHAARTATEEDHQHALHIAKIILCGECHTIESTS